jgi:hypothetical protein
MLKVTYLENGLYLEYLPETLEAWITLRVILALRMGRRLVVERTSASLLLPVDLVHRSNITVIAASDNLTIVQVDPEYIEISLQGAWISSDQQETEGVFVATLHPEVETRLFDLWKTAQANASSVWR